MRSVLEEPVGKTEVFEQEFVPVSPRLAHRDAIAHHSVANRDPKPPGAK